jgi:hypothetical protein
MLDFVTHFSLQIRPKIFGQSLPRAVGMNTFLEQGTVVSNYFSLSGIQSRPGTRIDFNPMSLQRPFESLFLGYAIYPRGGFVSQTSVK